MQCLYPYLHDGAGVGAVARLGSGRSAYIRQIRISCVVIIAGINGREGRRSIIVQDKSLACIVREVNDDIRSLCRSQDQSALIDVPEIEVRLVEVPVNRQVWSALPEPARIRLQFRSE